MKWGVIRFPGSLDDLDAIYGLRDVMGQDVHPLWHKDESIHGAECIVLPGGFSYGDHLRCGAIARFSPIMKSVAKFAAAVMTVHAPAKPVAFLCVGPDRGTHVVTGSRGLDRRALHGGYRLASVKAELGIK